MRVRKREILWDEYCVSLRVIAWANRLQSRLHGRMLMVVHLLLYTVVYILDFEVCQFSQSRTALELLFSSQLTVPTILQKQVVHMVAHRRASLGTTVLLFFMSPSTSAYSNITNRTLTLMIGISRPFDSPLIRSLVTNSASRGIIYEITRHNTSK